MKLFTVTHTIKIDNELLKLTCSILARNEEEAVNKAFRTIPKSYFERVIRFYTRELPQSPHLTKA